MITIIGIVAALFLVYSLFFMGNWYEMEITLNNGQEKIVLIEARNQSTAEMKMFDHVFHTHNGELIQSSSISSRKLPKKIDKKKQQIK